MTELRLQRILCPVDFSESSQRALDLALALAKRHGSQLAAMHVVPRALGDPATYPYLAEPVKPTTQTRDRAFRQLGAFVHRALAEKLPTDVILDDGDPLEAIIAKAEKLPADLLILGTHGRRGFKRLLLGSVTERVLRLAPCPVLSVSPRTKPAEIEEGVFRRVLCPVDFSASSLRGLEIARALLDSGGSDGDSGELDILHVTEPILEPGYGEPVPFDLGAIREHQRQRAEEKLGEIEAVLEDEPFRVESRVLASRRPYEEILELASERESDVIVIGMHSRPSADLLFFGSTTNHVVREATCPVLTFRSEEA